MQKRRILQQKKLLWNTYAIKSEAWLYKSTFLKNIHVQLMMEFCCLYFYVLFTTKNVLYHNLVYFFWYYIFNRLFSQLKHIWRVLKPINKYNYLYQVEPCGLNCGTTRWTFIRISLYFWWNSMKTQRKPNWNFGESQPEPRRWCQSRHLFNYNK